MRFDEFHCGQIIEAGPYPVTEAEVLDFAWRFDPQWFHTEPLAAKDGRWAGVIASGWHTCAIAMRLACDAALADSGSCGSPGLEYMGWPHPVRPGDSLTLRATIIGTRRSASRADLGLVRWRWQLFNQEEIEVLDTILTSLFEIQEGLCN